MPSGEFKQPVQIELNYLPTSNNRYTCYLSYRIPYNLLVFERRDNIYNAGYRISFEVFDKDKNFVVRKGDGQELKAGDFSITNSKNNFAEGIVSFTVEKNIYNILPIFIEKNSGREIKLAPISLNTEAEDEKDFLFPIITAEEINCGSKITLANYGGNIPFDDRSHLIFIPAPGKTKENIFVKAINNRDTIFSGKISEVIKMALGMEKCAETGKIILKELENEPPINYFVIRNLSQKLIEGSLSLIITEDENFSESETLSTKVVWYNKPLPLFDYEAAIKLLKHIEKEDEIKSLLKNDSEEYKKALYEYWKKHDPEPETAFNPVMQEYYERVDYAMREFSTITGRSGLSSDRGKVYVKLGKPDKVERSSSENGKVIETWFYTKPQRKYVFIDKRGTGDFSLKKG